MPPWVLAALALFATAVACFVTLLTSEPGTWRWIWGGLTASFVVQLIVWVRMWRSADRHERRS